jgi:predicted phosphodiesterase
LNIAVVSDIHGNLPALQAVIDDLTDFRPYRLLFAGDFTRGPYPDEVISLLCELEACMILGNDDLGLLRYTAGQVPEEWRTLKQFGSLRWTVRHISAENLAFLGGVPDETAVEIPGLPPIRLVHGAPGDPSEPILPQGNLDFLDRSLAKIDEAVLVCGHTHRQWCLRRNSKLALNPGAVAGTRIGPHAQYARMVWDRDDFRVDLRTIDYDIASLKQAFEDRGLLEEGGAVSKGFLLAMETGHDYMMEFLDYAHRLAGQAGCSDLPAIPDEVWNLTSKTFIWDA